MINLLIMFLLICGSLLSLAAAIGLVRLPDIFTRMHASTKAGTLGVGMVMLALGIASGEFIVIIKAIATFMFLIATAPVAAHMLGRAAYRQGEKLAEHTVRDDWQDPLRLKEPLN